MGESKVKGSRAWEQTVKKDLRIGLDFAARTSLKTPSEIRAFRARMRVGKLRLAASAPAQLRSGKSLTGKSLKGEILLPKKLGSGARAFEATIDRRKSERSYSGAPLSRGELRFLLESSLGEAIARAGDIDCGDAALWIRKVRGIKPGLYSYDHKRGALARTRPKQALRGRSSEDFGGAAALVFFRAKPRDLIEAYGARGWRFQWIALGSCFAHFYLACAAAGIGCCGIGGLCDELGLTRRDAPDICVGGAIAFGVLR